MTFAFFRRTLTLMPALRVSSDFTQTCSIAALAVALALPHPGNAAETSAIPHVGYLSVGSQASNRAFLDAFKDGLRELGYVEGRNIAIDVRWAGSSPSDFPQLAAALVRTTPDAIVTTCVPSTHAAKDATTIIPVVMSVDGDPVAAGLVASLARPGGNITGTSTLFEELMPKWLELLAAAVPKARVFAALLNPENVANPYFWAKLQQAAQRFNVKVVRVEAKSPEGLDRAFATMKRQHADAFVVMVDAVLASEAEHIVALADRYKLPGIYGYREFAEAGGLMSYGLSYRDYFKGVSRYVDKVLKGTKPEDLPVEQPSKIEFVINLVTAKKLGLTIPQELLLRADAQLD
jgi:putative tryptophan/tyrosine transport system substrate-binding protein